MQHFSSVCDEAGEMLRFVHFIDNSCCDIFLWSTRFVVCLLYLYPTHKNICVNGLLELFLFENWGVESILGPLGTAATTGLLYLPRMIVRMEKLVE
jgi:hypothetical protein